MTAPAGSSAKHQKPKGRGNFAFLRGFLRHPEQVASVVPSSRFLERRLVRFAEIGAADFIVELGPGTGGTTQAILDAMRPTARLLAIELTPEFVEVLRRHPDPRLTVHLGSAADIRSILAEHESAAPDVVVSGIPFSTMPRELGRRVISESYDSLSAGGCFVAYQVRDRVAVLGRQLLGEPEVETELLNVPPMRFYRWRRH